jgi:L-cystine uptake protein TcyP (sodium:dicarboxylate symporter family)
MTNPLFLGLVPFLLAFAVAAALPRRQAEPHWLVMVTWLAAVCACGVAALRIG